MSEKYYDCLVIDLMLQSKGFVEFAQECCPTYWLDGTKCDPISHLQNVASMEIEYLTYECSLL